VVFNIVVIYRTSRIAAVVRRAGLNGEAALRLRARRRRAILRCAAGAALVAAAVLPESRRVALWMVAVVLAWTSVSDARTDVRGEELAADRVMRKRIRKGDAA
jgi:hypothetical protein